LWREKVAVLLDEKEGDELENVLRAVHSTLAQGQAGRSTA
jgi:hypothetical protein